MISWIVRLRVRSISCIVSVGGGGWEWSTGGGDEDGGDLYGLPYETVAFM